jgi:NAD(P)-dependent dehydrogenase (short-subunit alcohol dehydrogenase family)
VKLNSSISAVVTGGASGLGAATARMLASHGVKVALFDLNADLGEPLAAEIGGVFCKVNVTSTPEVDAAFAKSRAATGQERILVNCAGIGGSVKTVSRDKQTREIKEYPLDNFERIIQVNLIGTFRCITKSAAGMLTLMSCRTAIAAQSSILRQSLRKTVRLDKPPIRPRRPALSG